MTMIEKEVRQKVNISPDEIKAYYNAHPDEFTSPRKIQARADSDRGASQRDAAQVEAARDKADSIHKQAPTAPTSASSRVSTPTTIPRPRAASSANSRPTI